MMDNVIYNDLIRRDLDVDVGVVEYNTRNADGKSMRKQLEVDFVVNRGSDRFYIQSALTVADPEKRSQEIASLLRIVECIINDKMRTIEDVSENVNSLILA